MKLLHSLHGAAHMGGAAASKDAYQNRWQSVCQVGVLDRRISYIKFIFWGLFHVDVNMIQSWGELLWNLSRPTFKMQRLTVDMSIITLSAWIRAIVAWCCHWDYNTLKNPCGTSWWVVSLIDALHNSNFIHEVLQGDVLILLHQIFPVNPKSAITPTGFSLFKSNLSLFSLLVPFILSGLSTVVAQDVHQNNPTKTPK